MNTIDDFVDLSDFQSEGKKDLGVLEFLRPLGVQYVTLQQFRKNDSSYKLSLHTTHVEISDFTLEDNNSICLIYLLGNRNNHYNLNVYMDYNNIFVLS